MPTDITNFLHSLVAAIAAATPAPALAAPATTNASNKRAIWAVEPIEEYATAVYTALRIYGGSEPPVFAGMRRRSRSIAVQHDTRGMDSQATLAQAWQVHEALIDAGANEQARTRWQIDGKRINAATGAIEADPAGPWRVRMVTFIGGPPGLRGRDGEGRWMASGNFDVRFERA